MIRHVNRVLRYSDEQSGHPSAQFRHPDRPSRQAKRDLDYVNNEKDNPNTVKTS